MTRHRPPTNAQDSFNACATFFQDAVDVNNARGFFAMGMKKRTEMGGNGHTPAPELIIMCGYSYIIMNRRRGAEPPRNPTNTAAGGRNPRGTPHISVAGGGTPLISTATNKAPAPKPPPFHHGYSLNPYTHSSVQSTLPNAQCYHQELYKMLREIYTRKIQSMQTSLI